MALSIMLPCNQVARRLLLRKHGLTGSAVVATEVAILSPNFVEVPPPWRGSAAPGTALIEVERPDETRLRFQYEDEPPPLEVVFRAFLERA